MSTYRDRFDGPAAVFSDRLSGGRLLIIVLVPILLVASVALVRASGLTTRPTALLSAGAAANLSPSELAAGAADALNLATAVAGTGYTFEIVQHATVTARPDGEPLEIEDPADPTKTITVESVRAGTYLERGAVTPAGFHAEIRRGPDDPTATADWDGTPMELAALVRDGTTYRNDGDGWYETDRPPGIGLDPATAALLPTLLRDLAEAKGADPPRDETDPFADLAPARRLDGATEVADVPGIIAVDLADATELIGPAKLAFDDDGRLVGLRILARNTHLDRYDLMVETVITFGYPDTAPELPKPGAEWVPPAAPTDGE